MDRMGLTGGNPPSKKFGWSAKFPGEFWTFRGKFGAPSGKFPGGFSGNLGAAVRISR